MKDITIRPQDIMARIVTDLKRSELDPETQAALDAAVHRMQEEILKDVYAYGKDCKPNAAEQERRNQAWAEEVARSSVLLGDNEDKTVRQLSDRLYSPMRTVVRLDMV